jgi:hypothetical protein
LIALTALDRIFLEAFGFFLPSFAMAGAGRFLQGVLAAVFPAAVEAVVACAVLVPVSVVSLAAFEPAWLGLLPAHLPGHPPAPRVPEGRLSAFFVDADGAEASA